MYHVATSVLIERVARVRAAMEHAGIDVLLLSLGADLPYLTGYEAMPLERLTMLVLPREGDATLVIPRLEAPRVHEHPEVFGLLPWDETQRPTELVADLVGTADVAAIGDRTWATFLVDLVNLLPRTRFAKASEVVAPIRARKDAAEVEALVVAGRAVDRVAAQVQGGEVRLVGRTEADVSAEIGRRLIAEGHDKVNFSIVAAMANAASPHHHAGDRVIAAGDVVLFDFGGTMAGYCSDVTRCVAIGEPPAEVAAAYSVLQEAQQAAVRSAAVGVTCEEVDATARRIITEGGYGERFIHRTGHGIGLEEHEDPYIVEGNRTPLAAGHAFSIEPGIYVAGRFGLRLEDIVVATEDGPLALNHADHALVVVDG